MKSHRGRPIIHSLRYVPLVITTVWAIFPLYWFFLLSIKDPLTFLSVPPSFVFNPTNMAYVDAFVARTKFIKYLVNSVIIASMSLGISLLLGLPAAYSFARFKFRGRQDLLFWMLTLRMVPPIVVVLPIYLIWRKLGLLDTWIGVAIVYLTFNVPFTIWMLKSFIQEVPSTLDEAAMVDGCSRIQAFLRVVLPLCAPGLAVTGVFCFIFSWNEFLFALILTSRDAKTLTVGALDFWTNVTVQWNTIAAISTVALIPPMIVSYIFSKYLVKGMTLGAIK